MQDHALSPDCCSGKYKKTGRIESPSFPLELCLAESAIKQNAECKNRTHSTALMDDIYVKKGRASAAIHVVYALHSRVSRRYSTVETMDSLYILNCFFFSITSSSYLRGRTHARYSISSRFLTNFALLSIFRKLISSNVFLTES